MPEIFVYLLKANLSIALFYLAYRLYLRRLTFYNLNRYFLLLGLVFSVCYPLAKNIRAWLRPVSENNANWTKYIPDWQQLNEKAKHLFTAWDIALLLFWCVVLFFFMRFLLRLHGLWRIHRKSSPSTFQYHRFRQVLLNINPFSFWRNIYLNDTKHEPLELKNILVHEQVHVRQLHTIDVLFGELISIAFWFNPASWLVRIAIRENLEFITDREVLLHGADKKAYQYSLLKVLTTADQPLLANNFNLRNIKKRIIMMNSKKSSKTNLTKYILITPVLVLFILGFTISKAYEKGMEKELIQFMQYTQTTAHETNEKEAVTTDTVPKEAKMMTLIATEVKKDTLPKIQVRSKSHDDASVYLDGKFLGKGSEHIQNMDPINIESVVVWKGEKALEKYGEKGKDGVIEVTSKKDSSNKDTLSKPSYESRIRIKNKDEKPLFVIDGEEKDEDALGNLDHNSIENISVLKGASAIAVYGTKGQNGAVIVTLKKDKTNGATPDSTENKENTAKTNVSVRGFRVKDKEDPSIVIRGLPLKDKEGKKLNPIYLIDREEKNEDELKNMDPNSIESIEVLKDAFAIELYGERGKNGVIIVTSKKDKKNDPATDSTKNLKL